MSLQSANWRRRRVSAALFRGPALIIFCILALLLSHLSAAGAAAQGSGGDGKLHPGLAASMEARPNDTFRVIVQWNNRGRPADATVRGLGGRKLRNLSIDGYVAEMPVRAIRALVRSPWVKAVNPDAELAPAGFVSSAGLTSIFPMSVNADWAWEDGFSGAGVGIAVIDSGINSALPDFRTASGASRVVVRKVFVDNPPAQLDPSGHGTLVAGIAAGNSQNHPIPGLRGRFMGVAPEANLIDLVVSDADGKSYTSDVVEAIEWAIANRVTYNIRVMNLSLVSSVAESYRDSILAAAVERAWFNGIFVVASAGNAGPNTSRFAPANDPFIVTVGASDSVGTWLRSDDGMAPWSSYGTTQDGFSKPDVVAPGRYIPGPTAASGTRLLGNFPNRVLANTNASYLWMSGTSMSAPVVAGIAALAFEGYPWWRNDQLKWQLMKTTSPLGNAAGQGAGLVDAYGVIWGWPEDGTAYYDPMSPGYANQGLTMSRQLVLASGSTTYNSASWSSASWSSASWSSASWSSASWSSASWSSGAGSAATQLQTSSVDLNSSQPVEAPGGR